MKLRSMILKVCLLSAMCWSGVQAGIIEDFQQDHEWYVINGKDRNEQCEVVASPMRQGKSLQFNWNKPRSKYSEVYLRKMLPLDGFDDSASPYHATVSVDLFSAGTPEPNQLSFRIKDNEDEAFQWVQSIDLKHRGWQTVTFKISPDQVKQFWGGKKKNPGVIDGKVCFVGLAIAYDRNVQPVNDPVLRQVYFGNISIQLPGEAVSANPANEKKVDAQPVDLKQIQVVLETGDPIRLIDPAQPNPAYLLLTNALKDTQHVNLNIKAKSFLGRTYELNRNVTLPAGQTVKQYLPLPQDKQDYWWIYHTLSDSSGIQQVQGCVLLGMMTPTGNNPTYHPKDRFLFGMCAHTTRYDDRSMQLEAYAAGLLGVDMIRSGYEWGSIQRENGETWNWTKFDREVELYRQQNIEIQYTFAYTPKWASTGDPNGKTHHTWSRFPPRIEPWQNYIDQITKRYQNDIRYWELWNEPDLQFFRGTAEEYIQMCKAAYPIVKKNIPNAYVLSGGWSATGRNPQFIETALPAIADSYDILALHGHGYFDPFQKTIDVQWRQLREKYAAQKPFYLNETGLATTGDTVHAEYKQAVDLVRKMTFTMARGAMSYNWYILRDDGNRANEHEDRMGMITHDFQAKPSYIAYNNLVRTLRGYRFIKQLKTTADQWLFLFENNKQYVLAGWAQQPYAVGQIVLNSDARQVTRIDILGNAQVLPRLSDGGVVIALESDPSYWVFDKSSQAPDMSNRLITLSGVTAWIPGQENSLNLTFSNPLKTDEDFVFRVKMPQALGGGLLQFEKRIAAGTSLALALPVGIVGENLEDTKAFTCKLDYQDKRYQIAGSCELPIEWAGLIVRDQYAVKPTFTLDQQEQVFDKYRSDPYNRHRVWAGPQDLSVQTWLAYTDTLLKVRVTIKDDKHVQNNPLNELWKSDSVQLAMQFPGQDGMWQIDFASDNDGRTMVNPGMSPVGYDTSAINASSLTCKTEKDQLVYELSLPLTTLKVTQDMLRKGLYLSMLVNEDDGESREGWIALSTGIGNGKDPSSYPFFIAR